MTKPNNQYASDWTGALGYDGNANLTSRSGWTFGYDAQNRLVSIDGGSTHIRYHYDPLNRIVAWDKNGAITTQVWDNWNLIEEHTGTDAFQRMYLHGAATNEVVVSYGPAWGDAYYWQDGRGNVTHLTDGSNNVKERYTYFVSGQPTYWTANTMNNRFLFEGALYIPEAEMYDMRNRFYHPNLDRFMQSDPVGLQVDGEKLSADAVAYFWAGKAPEKWGATELNTYRYCGNDPVDGSDPLGLEVGFWESLIPIWGSGRESVEAYGEGRWVMGTVFAAMAVTDIIPVKAGVTVLAKAGAKGIGKAVAKKEGTLIIGKLKDLSAETGWKKGEHVLNLPNQGSPKANWKQNSSALREAESSGTKIRDASTDTHGNLRDNTGFTRAERNLLENRGRDYDPSTREWKR